MTEAEWLACTDPNKMLDFLPSSRWGSRKQRLFGCITCRRLWWKLLTDDRSRRAVEIAELYADGLASEFELRAACEEAWQACNGHQLGTAPVVAFATTGEAASPFVSTDEQQRRQQCNWFRDIFGNPFRPLPPRPEAIAPLAEQIYAGAWDKMPLLGKRLQEHGYWSEGEHCLDPNIHHVKGCWVVDWVTGRD